MGPSKHTSKSWGARLMVRGPFLWLVVFFLIPFLIVIKISLSQTAIAMPPYVPALDLAAGWAGIQEFFTGLGLDNFATLLSDDIYALSYLKSLQVAAVSTAILLVIGYPIAYAMARAPRWLQSLLVMLVVLPFWTSFLIRVYAWINILQGDGLLNQALLWLRPLHPPAAWLPAP